MSASSPTDSAAQEPSIGTGPTRTRRALNASVLTSVSILILNMATGVLLARGLGPEGRGALAAAVLWPSILGAIGTVGLSESATYHAARRTASTGTLVGSGLVLAFAQSALFVAIGAAIIPLALSRQSDQIVSDARLFLGFIPLTVVALLLMGVLNGRQRYSAFHGLRLLVVAGAALPLFALFASGNMSVRSALWCYLIGNTVTLVAAIALLVRNEVIEVGFSTATLRQLLSYGLRSNFSSITLQLNERLDQLVISIFLAPVKLGLYVVAVTLTSLTHLVGHSVAYVVLPVLARWEAGPERTALARRFVSLTLAGSVLLAIPMGFLAPTLIEILFGAPFRSVAGISRILLLGVVILSTNRAMEAVLRAVGRPVDAGIAEVIALGATMGGLAILLPALELLGAALASLLAYAVSALWMGRRASAALDIPFTSLLTPDRKDVAWLRARLRGHAGRRRS